MRTNDSRDDACPARCRRAACGLIALLLIGSGLPPAARADVVRPAADEPVVATAPAASPDTGGAPPASHAPVATAAAADCAPVSARDDGVAAAADPPLPVPATQPRIGIRRSGSYCLAASVLQPPLWNGHAAARAYSRATDTIASIAASDVTLDLGGRRIANQWHPGGMTAIGLAAVPAGDEPFRRVAIRNGSVSSPGVEGDGIVLRSPSPASSDTRHRLENLTIDAGRHAIVVEGVGNVVRGNRIVVDAGTAIVAIGPGTLIEDNDIEIRGPPSGASGAVVPLRLVGADGAVVRNNRVRYAVAGGGWLDAGIRLTRSRDVTVEENRFERVAAAVVSDTQSTHRTRRNRFPSRAVAR